jgi:pSer/pThr/pTyr-binding forkhead associated (FHA) protein
MGNVTLGPKANTPSELKAQIEAERAGAPFLVYRDGEGEQRILTLGASDGPLWVGRRPSVDVCLDWDGEVSGVHAQLEPGGGEWAVVDDGLSRNGSYVNGDRVTARRRLRDGDMLRFGSTVVLYRVPGDDGGDSTVISTDPVAAVRLSDTQRRVLVALCRPFRDGSAFATPATNQQIADEVFLGVDAVKTHLRALFAKFGVEDLPQNRKRAALVERALRSGLISGREL